MVEITLSIVLQSVQTIGILVAIFYYFTIMRNTQKTRELTLKAQEQVLETRQAQLFMHIYSNWYSTDYWENWDNTMQFEFKDFDDVNEKITPEIRKSARSIFAFYEGLGVLVKRGLIEPSLIDDLMSAQVLSFWERWRDFYAEMRIRRKNPMAAEWIEYLYSVIKPIVEEQHPELKGKVLS